MEVRLYTVRKLATQLYEEVSFLKQKFLQKENCAFHFPKF